MSRCQSDSGQQGLLSAKCEFGNDNETERKNVVNHFNCIIVVVGKRFIINFQKVYSLQKLVKKLKEHFIRMLSLYFVVFALLL